MHLDQGELGGVLYPKTRQKQDGVVTDVPDHRRPDNGIHRADVPIVAVWIGPKLLAAHLVDRQLVPFGILSDESKGHTGSRGGDHQVVVISPGQMTQLHLANVHAHYHRVRQIRDRNEARVFTGSYKGQSFAARREGDVLEAGKATVSLQGGSRERPGEAQDCWNEDYCPQCETAHTTPFSDSAGD